MLPTTLAEWSLAVAVGAFIVSLFSAWSAWKSAAIARQAVEASLLEKRASIARELYEVVGEIVEGTEHVPDATMKALHRLSIEARLYFPRKAVRYISSIISAAYRYATHENRGVISEDYKRPSARAWVIPENLERWINPYASKPGWLTYLARRWFWIRNDWASKRAMKRRS